MNNIMYNYDIRKYCKKYFGDKFIERLDNFFKYICFTNHPIVQVIKYKNKNINSLLIRFFIYF